MHIYLNNCWHIRANVKTKANPERNRSRKWIENVLTTKTKCRPPAFSRPTKHISPFEDAPWIRMQYTKAVKSDHSVHTWRASPRGSRKKLKTYQRIVLALVLALALALAYWHWHTGNNGTGTGTGTGTGNTGAETRTCTGTGDWYG